MIEFFLCTLYVILLNNKKVNETDKIKKKFDNDDVTNYLICKKSNINIITFVTGLITLSISFFVSNIAYNCNNFKNEVSKILFALIGFFLPGIYLLFYIIWYLLLNNACKY